MKDEINRITAVMKDHRKQLRSYPNVVGYGVGYKMKGDKKLDKLAIIVFVKEKLPLSKLAPSEVIPSTLKQVITDVKETGEITANLMRTDKWRPAPPGVSMGHPNVTAGTFGCVVLKDSVRKILSNNHVIANCNEAEVGDDIYQPGVVDGGGPDDTIALLEDWVPIVFDDLEADNLVDCAIANPIDDTDILVRILQIGTPLGVTEAELDMDLFKSGRTSGVTYGQVEFINVEVNVNYGAPGHAWFVDQICYSRALSWAGDSGSIILTYPGRKAVALNFAASYEYGFGNRIQNVESLQGISILIVFIAEDSAVTVGTSTSATAVSRGFQRKGFHAAGLFWAFYAPVGGNAGWKFSADGITWDGDFTSIGHCVYGECLSIFFDGTYIHYTRFDLAGTWDLYYRRGTPESDGSITWCAAEQSVYAGGSSSNYQYPCIAVDTNGYAWIGVYNDDPAPEDRPIVLKNANNDGTWANDFYRYLSAVDDTTWKVCPVPLTDGKVYVVYCRDGQLPLGQLYDGDWDAGEENDLADFAIESGAYFSAGAILDNVHFVYNRDTTNQIRHNIRIYGVGWNAADVLVHDPVTNKTGPSLSVDPFTGDLYCFWEDTATDHIYYKQYTDDVWDAAPTDWIDESIDDLPDDYLLSSYYMNHNGFIGVLYTTLLASPYDVRIKILRLPIVGLVGTMELSQITGIITEVT